MMHTTVIERLARLRGIGDAYHDYRGELRHFSLETKIGLLRAMGCKVDDPAALALELSQLELVRWRKFLPAVAAARGGRIGIDINVTAREFGSTLVWSVRFEDGSRRDGAISTADCPEIWRGEVEGSWVTRRRFELPVDLPSGYHELEAKVAGGTADRCLLIISPPRCYEPASIIAGRRLWGIAVQLYTLRSRENWGIGDFNDLRALIRWVASHGAGFIGLNPLHALAPADPERSSPYSASSRHFLNVLYIAVPLVPEFQECAAARERMADPAVAERLQELRGRELVDYRGVADLKFEILALLYRDFCDRHLALGTDRARDFRAFTSAGGDLLQLHARFDALDRYFRATLGIASGWQSWPEEFRDANGNAETRSSRNAQNLPRVDLVRIAEHGLVGFDVRHADGFDSRDASPQPLPESFRRLAADPEADQGPGFNEDVIACNERLPGRQNILGAAVARIRRVGRSVPDRCVYEETHEIVAVSAAGVFRARHVRSFAFDQVYGERKFHRRLQRVSIEFPVALHGMPVSRI